MRYMLLIYSREDETATAEQMQAVSQTHLALMNEAKHRGVFHGAEPLAPSMTATTVRADSGTMMLIDGPFAETKEQLAGYYILECQDLDEAIEWAAKIPTACQGAPGCIEIRPLRNG